MSEFPPYQAALPRPPASATGAWPRSLGASSAVAIVGLGSTIVAATIGLIHPAGVLRPTLIVVTLIFAGIAFITWLYRARVNLDYFGVHDLRWKSGWTIGSWFIPFANFVLPVRVINEVDRASAQRADFADGGRGRPPYGRVVFVLWAITWTGYLLLDRFARVGSPSLVDLPARDLDKFGALSAVSAALGVSAAVCAILLVRRVTANQDRVLATLLAGMPSVPAHPVPSQGAARPYPPTRFPAMHPQASDPQAWAGAETPPSQRPPTAPYPPTAARPDPLEEPPPPPSDPWPSAGF
jgi:hypothetical protein